MPTDHAKSSARYQFDTQHPFYYYLFGKCFDPAIEREVTIDKKLLKTVFHDRHVHGGAKMVEFAGRYMPLHYRSGIIREHLATRKHAGLFDVSHMGRFIVRGKNRLPFLQHVLSNNAAGLEVEESLYTTIPNEQGGAIDDAYLYRFFEDEYLLVVNAANREKVLRHCQPYLRAYGHVIFEDQTEDLVMLSLQGPAVKKIMHKAISRGHLPEPLRNELAITHIDAAQVLTARTGYTGEPLCFELFVNRKDAVVIWDRLTDLGAQPAGLGARDTLRLEAGLPLYGHELGTDLEGNEIPVFASALSRFAVSFSPLKGDYVGRASLENQFAALKKIIDRDFTMIDALPRIIMPVALIDKGVPRQGYKVFQGEHQVGYVTSGTKVPFWKSEGEGIATRLTEEKGLRGICLALLNSDLYEGDELQIEIRGKMVRSVVVPYHLRSEAPPFARAVLWDKIHQKAREVIDSKTREKVRLLLDRSIDNTIWRQQRCINLIPSEQTPSKMVRLLSVMDPVCRYAEHKQVMAFSEAEIFYYQGTDFIAQVEELLNNEICRFLGCAQVESRVVSGQMANTAVFSAMVDYLNRADRKSEQRRIRKVLNHHIIKGGHLSAQPMGALRDFVARDPKTEKAAVVNFPVLEDNSFRIDVPACLEIIAEHRPELIIFGKSMTLHTEPIGEIREFVDTEGIDCRILYDMAHVLGLVGPYFQRPFEEGADIVTGSTHKTFFGTQRGIIGSNYILNEPDFEFWEAVQRRAFPGSVSNHHLGTLLGLLMAAYEMNFFKNDYQKKVLANARAFAGALRTCGLDVAGDPDISYTQTHQVILRVGYAQGPEIARQLEENNIVVNYQAAPEEEGFTAAGALRMGVQEMTRFGMEAEDFQELAQLIYDIVVNNRIVEEKVASFRKRFLEMKFCFSSEQFEDQISRLHRLI
ncbi:MAG: glycine cleavage system aminomethyltransferase GcvT [Desulfobacterales bacterium]|nr:glycine cleavage system aminomethyltransferase GcvT [Desulfobacterales bacterium]